VKTSWLTHPWLSVRVQIALGAIFVSASLPKILDPPTFAHMIYNYRLVPGSFINVMALVLPWIEMISGVALILGAWRRTAATVIAGLLLIFALAMSINIVRDNAVDCGCWGSSRDGAKRSHEQLISELRWADLRDLGMLLLAGQILLSERNARLQDNEPRRR
jgi:uncharacterized membrane protein YphA (DoxX/SURF4 family)